MNFSEILSLMFNETMALPFRAKNIEIISDNDQYEQIESLRLSSNEPVTKTLSPTKSARGKKKNN